MFTVIRPFPGISHITDAMGVSFTLIEGVKRALLYDAGYGTEDVHAYVRTLTDKPVKVLLSHGHHDHILGARWFEQTWICREDLEEFSVRTGTDQRIRVKQQAENLGVPVPDDFLEAPIAPPDTLAFPEKTGRYESVTEELGGLKARVVHVPGHTPGSIVVFVPEYGLLLTGDDWNPCTWMWFPSSMAADAWRDNMKDLADALESAHGTEISSVLCSHQPAVRKGSELKSFLSWMTDERMQAAPPVDMGSPIDTHQVVKEPEGWALIFDRTKIRRT